MTIAILCPTRARPELFKRMVESAHATASDIKNLRFYPALRTEDLDAYNPYLGCATRVHVMPDGMPTCHKWNFMAEGARKEDNKLFMLAGDDMIFTTPFWDKALLDHYNALENKIHVYALRDSRDPAGTPHPIVSRQYIQAMGYFLPPIFLHWHVDTWTVEIAKANTCFTHLKDYQLVHEKPWDKGIADETHKFIHKMGWLNSDIWTNEHCRHLLETEKARLKCAFG